MSKPPVTYNTAQVLAARGPKNDVSVHRPYAFLVEQEMTADGVLEDVATIFLTNRECPYHCLMCDLWKNTLEKTVPVGAIPAQIRWALSQLPPAQHIKLYNSGNFFDPKAIPVDDFEEIAELLSEFKTVIVENHPKLCTRRCIEFQQIINGQLEIALGLETIEPTVLAALNKQMTVNDFDRSARFLREANIALRTFILIRPPYMTDQEGVDWALRSLKHAFAQGVATCSLIPTRAGNGIMEQLESKGEFTPPSLSAIEEAFEAGLNLKQGRVFLDTWDLKKFPSCGRCDESRYQRLREMNLSQTVISRIECDCLL